MNIEISEAGLLAFVKKELDRSDIENSIIYWDSRIIDKNEQIRSGKKSFSYPYKSYLLFVDLAPRANWGHPCIFFIIDENGNQFEMRREEFPPYYGEYPESWTVLLRYGEKPPHNRYFNIY